MTSAREAPDRLSSQALLDKLYRMYGNRPVQRDPFGRRAALASEIERALAGARETSPVATQKPAAE